MSSERELARLRAAMKEIAQRPDVGANARRLLVHLAEPASTVPAMVLSAADSVIKAAKLESLTPTEEGDLL